MPDVEAHAGAQVIRLRSIRTLVVARDLSFRQRVVTVLTDLGVVAFAITSLDRVDDVVALIERERADVVVLDATGCAPAAARLVFELADVSPRVGVVLVADDGDARHGLRTLPKWGWAVDLSRAVQQAYHHGNPLVEEDCVNVQHHC